MMFVLVGHQSLSIAGHNEVIVFEPINGLETPSLGRNWFHVAYLFELRRGRCEEGNISWRAWNVQEVERFCCGRFPVELRLLHGIGGVTQVDQHVWHEVDSFTWWNFILLRIMIDFVKWNFQFDEDFSVPFAEMLEDWIGPSGMWRSLSWEFRCLREGTDGTDVARDGKDMWSSREWR